MKRRDFVKLATAAVAFPTIVPARVLGKNAPSNNIQLAQIGCGRIADGMDVPGFLRCAGARFVAACDLDSKRLEQMQKRIETFYAKKGRPGVIVGERDFHEVINRKDVDAVVVSTPDHWHAQIAVEAAFAKKHVYMQKPCSLTIREGRVFSNSIRENGVKFLQGSQQRSWDQFQKACAFVREGRLGKIKLIQVGLPGDPAGGNTKEMPVPQNLDYDFWLGSTPISEGFFSFLIFFVLTSFSFSARMRFRSSAAGSSFGSCGTSLPRMARSRIFALTFSMVVISPYLLPRCRFLCLPVSPN